MDLIRNAKVVTLRSQRGRTGKYLVANDNNESVSRAENGSSGNERWSVELVPNSQFIRLKSCYNNYLTASTETCLFGGFKVRQTKPERRDNSIEWEPIRENGNHSNQVKLKTREGTYLRACEKRWKTVTHERNANIQDGILWDVEILEITLEAATTYYNLATQAEKDLAQAYFKSMDTDGDGKVSIDEFVNFFKELDSRLDRSFFDALDENRDGSLEFLEVFRLRHMLNRTRFVESLTRAANVQQPGAQNGRIKIVAKALLAFLTAGLQIAVSLVAPSEPMDI